MYELFATFCILVNGVPECTTYSDNKKIIYKDLKTCEERAEYRFYETAGGFMQSTYRSSLSLLVARAGMNLNP